jgi:hypothetical protein
MALSWLKNYPNENNHAGNWGLCENIVRKHTWDYVIALQLLKRIKIVWACDDTENLPQEIFVFSVDGIHCKISELRTEPNKKWCSYKMKCAGVVYELAISIYDGKLIWINGPFPGGTTDLIVFRNGLKEKIPPGK